VISEIAVSHTTKAAPQDSNDCETNYDEHLQPNSLAKCPGKDVPMLSFDAEGGVFEGKGSREGSGALTVLKPEPCWYGP
jgi:hypothetical protein